MNNTLLYTVLLLVAIGGGVILTACGGTRSRSESAPYEVVRTDGDFEVRKYPELVVVETPRRDGDNSFGRLFRYISGDNTAAQKISMTTPVFMAGESTNATMAFVLPQGKPAPQPKGADVTVKTLPAGTFAVFRYSGRRNARREAEALARLTAWQQRENLPAAGAPVYGYFDPPWTPPFLRRNEVMVPVAVTR